MKTKYFVLILCAMSLISSCISPSKKQSNNCVSPQEEQSENILCTDYNITDANGKKQGLWIEESGRTRIERHYKDGIRSGVYKQFFAGKLSILGEYTNDKESGIWYIYDNERVWMTFENHAQNYDTITREWDKKRYVPDYKCYSKAYYPNGNIKDEGWLLWNEGESPESDLSIEYGEWKYYDEEGNLVRTKVFQ